ncbi:MAG: lysoplasmalogenase family protein [Knoellia sp.]
MPPRPSRRADLVVACAPRAGALTVGIALYAGALALMSLLANGVDRLAGIGGVLFMTSDGLIAIGEFVPAIDVPLSGFWVMATYLSAILLLTLGVLRRFGSCV